MSTRPVKDSSSDHLIWLGQQIYKGISAVASTASKAASAVKHVLEFGEHDGAPEVLKHFELKRFHYPPSPSSIKLGTTPPNWVKPAPNFTNIARGQKILPPLTEAERIDEGRQAHYQTSTEAVLKELYELQDGELVDSSK